MFYNYYQTDEYQYDSCTAKGICSLTPIVSSLQEVIVMYLKNIAYYTLKLKDMGVSNEQVRDNIIADLSILVSNSDYVKEEYEEMIYSLFVILNESRSLYKKLCNKRDIPFEVLKSHLKMAKKVDMNTLIKRGEKEFLKKSKEFPKRIRNLFEIMFFLIKSVCINLIELKSYDNDYDEAYYSILRLLNLMNNSEIKEKEIMTEIQECSRINYEMIKRLKELQSKEYGEPKPVTISFSTKPGKAILVSGSGYKELEAILELTKDKNIDVYTHGAMILAHTHPKFQKYKHLKGQFGIGVENCLLDFATFPGAILMTKHSLQNVEYLYRGRLFTTDLTAPKGVVKIKDNDFTPVVEAALEARGFSKGMEKDSMPVGYFENEVLDYVDSVVEKIKEDKIEYIFLIGNLTKTNPKKKYFEKLISLQPEKSCVISLNCESMAKNIFQINSCYDFTLIYNILEHFSKEFPLKSLNIHVFLTKCDMHTIAHLLNLKFLGLKNIYLTACSPKLINPVIMDSFKNIFKINTMTNPEYDIAMITGNAD